MILNFWPFNIKRKKKERKRKKRLIIILCLSGAGVVLLGATTGITVALTQNKDTVLKNKNQATKYLKKHAVQTNPSSFEFNDYDCDNQQDYDFICSNLTLQLFVNSAITSLLIYIPPFPSDINDMTYSGVSGIHIQSHKNNFTVQASLSIGQKGETSHLFYFYANGLIRNNLLYYVFVMESSSDTGGDTFLSKRIYNYELINAFATNLHYITCLYNTSVNYDSRLCLRFRVNDPIDEIPIIDQSIMLSPYDWEGISPKT